MVFPAVGVRVLIASPSDLREERDRVESVIHAWNALHAAHHGVILLPVRWETNASAELGAPAQDVINRQIVEDCDVLIGLFWTRLGSPTAKSKSGTAEELQAFLDTGRPASLFVSKRPVEPDLLDQTQYAALKDFLRLQRSNGLLEEFQTPEELGHQVERALTRIVREKFATDLGGATVRALAEPVVPAADVRASHTGYGSRHEIVLTNVGAGEARQVAISTLDTEGSGRGWDLMSSDRPLDFMQPGGSYSFQASLNFESPSRVNCTVTWLSPDSSTGESRQTVGLF